MFGLQIPLAFSFCSLVHLLGIRYLMDTGIEINVFFKDNHEVDFMNLACSESAHCAQCQHILDPD